LAFTPDVSAQKNWTLEKEEDGIKVYTKRESGSSYKAFKAEMQVNCTIEDLFGIFKDANSFGKCVTYCKEIKLLKAEEDAVYYYIETSLPWPFDNRDMVYQLKFSERNGNQAKVIVTGMPSYVQQREGVVRIEKANGYWVLDAMDANRTAVTYQMHVEAGGSIPAWLANLSIVNIPYSTFMELRKIVQ